MTAPPSRAAGSVLEVTVPAPDLDAERRWFEELGARALSLFPADDPTTIVIELAGTRLRLERRVDAPPPSIRIVDRDRRGEMVAPGGTRVSFGPAGPPRPSGSPEHAVVRAGDSPAGVGRAGMRYRDLVPGRHGGSVIASWIEVADGAVGDEVHHHDLDAQLIICERGRVRLAYEDQGPPFWLRAGDVLVQPPGIRHRVLDAADDLVVIEVASPAEHLTHFDPSTSLPSSTVDHERRWEGQRFVCHARTDATWEPGESPGWWSWKTAIGEATRGVARVRALRSGSGGDDPSSGGSMIVPAPDETLRLVVVRRGRLELDHRAGDGAIERLILERGDAATFPPEHAYTPSAGPSDDVEWWEIVLVTGVSGGSDDAD